VPNYLADPGTLYVKPHDATVYEQSTKGGMRLYSHWHVGWVTEAREYFKRL
jgi:hypothetical protein